MPVTYYMPVRGRIYVAVFVYKNGNDRRSSSTLASRVRLRGAASQKTTATTMTAKDQCREGLKNAKRDVSLNAPTGETDYR